MARSIESRPENIVDYTVSKIRQKLADRRLTDAERERLQAIFDDLMAEN